MKTQVKRDFKYHMTLVRQWRHKTRFQKREGLQTLILILILRIFASRMLNKQCKS